MKYRIAASLCFFLVELVGFAQAQPAQPQPTAPDFVIVNFNAVVLQTAEAQRDLGALQTKFAPRQAHLQSLNDEIENLRKQLADSGNKLSQGEQAMRTQALESKEKQFQREAEDFRSDSQSQSQEVFQRVAQKIYGFLQTYSKQHGYAAVIERGSDASPVVWYSADNLDITDQLIKAYNAQSGADAPAATSGPAHSGSSKPPQSLPESPTAKPQL